MTGFTYVTFEQVVALNRAYGGAGAGVLNADGIKAQLERAEASFDGIDLYPDVWLKAAALIHGISSTQYFSDGNKRTAWIVADLFVSVNLSPLRDIPTTHAEAFVLAVATGVYSLEQAAEWLKDARVRASDRLTWLDTMDQVSFPHPGSAVMNVQFMGFRDIEIEDPTVDDGLISGFYLSLLLVWQFVPADLGRDFTITYDVESRADPSPFFIHPELIGPYSLPARRILGTGPTGIRIVQETTLIINGYGSASILVGLDGEEAGRVELEITPPQRLSEADLQRLQGPS